MLHRGGRKTILSRASRLTDYIHPVMRLAHFEIMENGRFCGSIPGFQGVWSEGATLEECRDEMVEAMDGWLIVKMR